jgi:hypothetical protein
MQYEVDLAFPVAVLSFLLGGLIGPKDVLLVKDLAKGQSKAVHQRYFDAKSPYWPLQRVDERYPVEM